MYAGSEEVKLCRFVRMSPVLCACGCGVNPPIVKIDWEGEENVE